YFTAIQADFGRLSDDVKDIRIQLASLERRVIAIEDILTEHGQLLRSHDQLLKSHDRLLKSHDRLLQSHGRELKAIKKVLLEIKHNRDKDRGRLAELEHRVFRLETKVYSKIS
ncbi:hypothetical protein HY573_00465, partial [Candidatus Parcubacteria bacterium]|nr:hypothetical protein [Candidatus Parcubacteria bacterium]